MPYNSPMQKKGSACKQLKNHRGKPSGFMMEGSVAHMSMLHQESTKQKKENLEGPKGENPVVDKGTALEMSPYKMDHEGSPNKMSPLNDNHPGYDPKTGERKIQPFVDTPAPEGFVSSMGENYDENEATNIFTNAQNQVLNALSLAEKQLKGEEVFNKLIKGGYGSTAITGPQAAQIITGYSAGEEGEETVGGQGKVRFNISAVENKLNELKELAVTDPVAARNYISKRLSGAPLGDFSKTFMRDIDPLLRN